MRDSFEYLNDEEITNIQINHADKIKWLSDVLEDYANQRVIEELERLKSDCDAEDDAYSFAMAKAHQKRIKQLKQD